MISLEHSCWDHHTELLNITTPIMVYIQTMENLVKTPQCFQSDFSQWKRDTIKVSNTVQNYSTSLPHLKSWHNVTNIYTPHWQVFLITEPWTPLTSDMDSTMAQQFSANHWYVWGGDGWKSYLNSLLWHVSCVTLWTRSASNLKWGSWRGF